MSRIGDFVIKTSLGAFSAALLYIVIRGLMFLFEFISVTDLKTIAGVAIAVYLCWALGSLVLAVTEYNK